jgi:CspA family cold shock protein
MARETGTVKWFSNEKGYGFIERGDGEDVFVHHSDILGDGFKTLEPDEEVEFELVSADKGPKALEVVREGDSYEELSSDGGGDRREAASRGSSRGPERSAETPAGGSEEDRKSLGAQLREKLGNRFFGDG